MGMAENTERKRKSRFMKEKGSEIEILKRERLVPLRMPAAIHAPIPGSRNSACRPFCIWAAACVPSKIIIAGHQARDQHQHEYGLRRMVLAVFLGNIIALGPEDAPSNHAHHAGQKH